MMTVTLTAYDSDTQCSYYAFNLFHNNGQIQFSFKTSCGPPQNMWYRHSCFKMLFAKRGPKQAEPQNTDDLSVLYSVD